MSDSTPTLTIEQKTELFRQTLAIEKQIEELQANYSRHCKAIKDNMPPGPWNVGGRMLAIGKRGEAYFLKEYSPTAREEIVL